MKELKVGEKVVLKVVKTEKEECNGCFFDEISSNIYETVCNNFNCSASTRKDRKNVQFKRVK